MRLEDDRYEVRDIDQTAEIVALKAERDRLTIIADAIQAERDRLRAAGENIMRLVKCRDVTDEEWDAAIDQLRSALEGK